MKRLLTTLVAFVEGRRPWSEWTTWLPVHKKALEPLLVPRERILLHFRPDRALPRILERLAIPFDTSETFLKASRRPRRPATPPRVKRLTHPALGHLYWKEQCAAYSGRIAVSGSDISVLVIPDRATTAEATRVAEVAISRLRRREGQLRRYATARLRSTYNSAWNDGVSISAADFLARLRPRDFHVYDNGQATLYYHDGGLFHGHAVAVSVTSAGIPHAASIEG